MFGKKQQDLEPGQALPEEPKKEAAEEKKEETSTPTSIGGLAAEVDKITAKISSFSEMQKASNERFTRVGEQIGELRTMIIERDRASQHLEAKATQAIDLVETIKPEKLMIEVRKEDMKIEALRANLESNEAMLKNSINELKEVRQRLSFFKGMDEITKLADEVKKELSQIKLVEGVVERHANKVDTIFGEMQKGFGEYVTLGDTLKNLDETTKQLSTDVDSLKIKAKELAGKKELTVLTNRMDEFEKKVGAVLDLLNKRFKEFEDRTNKHIDENLAKTEKLLTGFETLAKKTPDLDKYFNLISEEAKKAEKPATPEKIKQPGEEGSAVEEAEAAKAEAKAKGGLLKKLNPMKKKEAAAEKKE